ncbi:MAG: hypothetical protein KGL36_03300 [Gammaproteobacteria bacterium]|nr:hypothetical protein [Gammaproteobacteria bacterium]
MTTITNPLTNPLATTPPASSASAAGIQAATSSATQLSGANFLTLMLAQLKNQDPTQPVNSNQFLSQLAALSEVQGITQLNSSFSSLSNSLVSSQALQASSLLGHQALVPSSQATLATTGATLTGAVQVPQTTADVVVNVSSPNGVLVRQIDLGAQPAGLSNFTWDGKLADGSQAPAGQYSLSAQVAGVASGTAVPTYVNGTVQSVTMGAGATGLTLDVAGLGSVPFANVQQISN